MQNVRRIVSVFLFLGLIISLFPVQTFAGGLTIQETSKGFFVVEKGKKTPTVWYVNPFDGQKYSVRATATLRYLAIPHDLLPAIESSADEVTGRLYLTEAIPHQFTSKQYWYVHPETNMTYTFKNGPAAAKKMRSLAKQLTKAELKTIPTGKVPQKLQAFASAKQFDSFVASLDRKRKNELKKSEAMYADFEEGEGGGAEEGGFAEEGGGVEATAASVSEPGESITNVQEIGVDEGGIVKTYKDFLVVLRRGKLFSVKTKDGITPMLTPISSVNAFPGGAPLSDWYDEMLISENRIVVVGYSYRMRGTEIGIFNIADNGLITHSATYFLDSDDYYSSRNFASRLVGNTLIFYVPYYFWDFIEYPNGQENRPVAKLPAMRKWLPGEKGENTTEGESVLKKVNVYRSPHEDFYPTMHTVVKCELGAELDCSGTSVLGPSSRSFYVSPSAVYLWVTDWGKDSEVYRMDLEKDDVTMARTHGSPVDQFSFKELDGYLNVLVRSDGNGDAMWNSETQTGNTALLRTPLSVFGNVSQLVSQDAYTALPAPDGYGFQNRYVGDYLLYGAGGAWWEKSPSETLYIKRVSDTSPTQTIDLSQSIDRIEPMGSNAVVVGSSESDLKFTSIDLAEKSEVADTYTLANAAQGELRSHGFFFKPEANGIGTLGLPVRVKGDAIDSHFDAAADVLFLKVSELLKFTDIGSLKSKTGDKPDDGCLVSCVDWYGNARPVFFGGRIFALLGYELVEGVLGSDAYLIELRRAEFTPSVVPRG